ncbi:Fic family protein [Microbacterium sp. dk485]|uniref:Fic family protein n=1 Tax=Microbacterium sp. dk485 TaxID=2560021 RepID=UPI0010746272|nr:Fic family protein [Microbacterium sp. dk485]TFV83678.1 Fic family protein [Microbacterium sp. dk485]
MEVWPAHRFDDDGAAIPPSIAELDYAPSLRTVGTCESALIAVAQADADGAGSRGALSSFMIRCESAASARIDGIRAEGAEYAQAVAGLGGIDNARGMVATGAAVAGLLDGVDARGAFTVDDLRAAQALLVGAEAPPGPGGMRRTDTAIGSAADAPYVPPAPDRVPALLEDLVVFLNRDDVPVIVQAAIAHAQFASIRPFAGGNGRIGRALLVASLRRRGVSGHAVVPLACGLAARQEEYVESLVAFRDGDPSPIVVLVATCARVAATESRITAARVKALPDEWRAAVKPRRGSAAAALLSAFAERLAMGAAELERHCGAGRARAYQAVERLVSAGVIHEVTGRKRGRVWAATDLLAESDDLDRRIHAAMGGGRRESAPDPAG